MNIFLIYFSQNFIEIYTKTHQIATFKNNLTGERTSESPSKRVAPLNLKKVGPPLANPAYAQEQWTHLISYTVLD